MHPPHCNFKYFLTPLAFKHEVLNGNSVYWVGVPNFTCLAALMYPPNIGCLVAVPILTGLPKSAADNAGTRIRDAVTRRDRGQINWWTILPLPLPDLQAIPHCFGLTKARLSQHVAQPYGVE